MFFIGMMQIIIHKGKRGGVFWFKLNSWVFIKMFWFLLLKVFKNAIFAAKSIT